MKKFDLSPDRSTTLNIYAYTFEEAQAKASEAVADILKFGDRENAGLP